LKNDATDLYESETAAVLREEFFAEGLLQGPQLAANCGLGEAKPFTRPRDAAFFGDDPEVEEVMIVKPFHTIHNTSSITID